MRLSYNLCRRGILRRRRFAAGRLYVLLRGFGFFRGGVACHLGGSGWRRGMA